MADTYIWHDFCGQQSGPDMSDLFLKYYTVGTGIQMQEYEIATYASNTLTIHNDLLYNDFLSLVQCNLSYSGNVSLWIYRYIPNGDTYFRIKGSGNITFTFNNGNNKCKVKYYVATSPHYYAYEADSNTITCPANEDRFIYEINYQTNIASNMAYRVNGVSYLKYADFLTDDTDNSGWEKNDAGSVGGIKISNSAKWGWNNIKHYSIPNYYIGQSGGSSRGMRRINAAGMPSIDRDNNNNFRYKSTPSGLKSKQEDNWQFIDWQPEIWSDEGMRYVGYTYDINNNNIRVLNGSSVVKTASLTNGDEFYIIKWSANYSLDISDNGCSISETSREGDWNWGKRYYGANSKIKFTTNRNSGGFYYYKTRGTNLISSDQWTSFETNIFNSLCSTSIDTTTETLSASGWDSPEYTVSRLPDDSNFFNNYIEINSLNAEVKMTTEIFSISLKNTSSSKYSSHICNLIEIIADNSTWNILYESNPPSGWEPPSWVGRIVGYRYINIPLNVYLNPMPGVSITSDNFSQNTSLALAYDVWGQDVSNWAPYFWRSISNISPYSVSGQSFLIIKLTKKQS